LVLGRCQIYFETKSSKDVSAVFFVTTQDLKQQSLQVDDVS